MRVLSDGRVRRSEAEWRGLVERFSKSGLSISAFCRRMKLTRSSFVQWRKRVSPTARAASTPAFVEWIAPAAVQTEVAEPSRCAAGEFELALPGGVVLRWKA